MKMNWRDIGVKMVNLYLVLLLAPEKEFVECAGLWGGGGHGGWDHVGAEGGAEGRAVLGHRAQPASGGRAQGQAVWADGRTPV